MNAIERNLTDLRKEIVPYKPLIIAVTKYFGVEKLVEAYNAGLKNFGENRVQDALEKFSELPDGIRKDSKFHLIGHLQKNKVKKAVGTFDLIQSVDSFNLAKAISEEALRQGIVQKILIQVNNANEECKFGFSKKELDSCFADIMKLEGTRVEGLMNIAPVTTDENLKLLFEDMRMYKQELEKKHSYLLKELSMGMSNDYMIALGEGSTMIRLGRKLFM